MKNLISVFSIALLLFFAGSVSGQDLKFGHIDLQALIQVMPELTTAEAEYSKEAKGLEDQLASMQKELEEKFKVYAEKRDSLTEIVRAAKESEIQNMQQNIQSFQAVAQQQLQKKQNDMLKPIFDKADKAISEVAKEKGLIYVFDTSSRVVLYQSPQSLDLMPLAKAKLGIK